MQIVTLTDERLVVNCPRVGTGFAVCVIAMGSFAFVILPSAEDARDLFFGLLCLLVLAFGILILWTSGPVQLTLDRTTGLATVTRPFPHMTKVETYSLNKIEDVTNAYASEGTGYGLAFEMLDGQRVGIASANYCNGEARSVGKEILSWLKTNGYR